VTRAGMLEPHAVQVIGMILLMNLDCPKDESIGLRKAWNSVWNFFRSSDGGDGQGHLLQVGTGEGKSMILGCLALLFALEHDTTVDCMCYSQLLADRDYEYFQDVFKAFGVQNRITYGSFSVLAREEFQRQGEVRSGVEKLFQGELRPNSVPCKTKRVNRILLLDEVDVFFQQHTFGSTYNPSVVVASTEFTLLLRKIWQHREMVSSDIVKGWDEHTDLVNHYKKQISNVEACEKFLALHVESILEQCACMTSMSIRCTMAKLPTLIMVFLMTPSPMGIQPCLPTCRRLTMGRWKALWLKATWV